MKDMWFLLVVLLVLFIGTYAYMYPEPTWKFGRSTTYKWSEVVVQDDTHSTKTHCVVWVQSTQAWNQCADFPVNEISSLPVQWVNQSARVENNLPPK